MKAIKRTVAALLATLMLATSTSFTLAAENYTDDEAVVVAKVNAAGIMTGTDKGFEPSKTLTRAEAAAIIVRMKGISESAVKTAAGTTLFKDVAAAHWASGYVNQASNLGIVKGVSATEFAPDREVTVAEFTTMAVRALGAGQLVDSEGVWPTNYVNFANEEGILDDVNAIYTATASRLQAATIVANTLETKMWKKSGVKSNGEIEWSKTSDTIIDDVLKLEEVYFKLDKVSNNDQEVTVVGFYDEASKLLAGSLASNTYDVAERFDLSGLKVGLTYNAYIDEDNEIQGMWLDDEDTVSFEGVKKINSTKDILTLIVDGKEKEYDYKTGNIVRVNEKAAQSVETAITGEDKNMFGTIYLDDKGDIEAIYATKYTTYAVVKELKPSKVKMNDDIKGGNTTAISYDVEDNEYFLTKNGTGISYSDLKEDDAIAYYTVSIAKGKKYVGEVLTDVVEGKVTATKDITSAQTLTIGGKKYDTVADWSIKAGDEVNAWLNHAGKIVMLEVVDKETASDVAIVKYMRSVKDKYDAVNYEIKLVYLDGTVSDTLTVDLEETGKEFAESSLARIEASMDIDGDSKYLYDGNRVLKAALETAIGDLDNIDSDTEYEDFARKLLPAVARLGEVACVEVSGSEVTFKPVSDGKDLEFNAIPAASTLKMDTRYSYVSAATGVTGKIYVDEDTKFIKVKADGTYEVKFEVVDYNDLDDTTFAGLSYLVNYDEDNYTCDAVIFGIGTVVARTSEANFAFIEEIRSAEKVDGKASIEVDVIYQDGKEATLTAIDGTTEHYSSLSEEKFVDLSVSGDMITDVDVLNTSITDRLAKASGTGIIDEYLDAKSRLTLMDNFNGTFEAAVNDAKVFDTKVFTLAEDVLVVEEKSDDFVVRSISDLEEYVDSTDDYVQIVDMAVYTDDDKTEVKLVVFKVVDKTELTTLDTTAKTSAGTYSFTAAAGQYFGNVTTAGITVTSTLEVESFEITTVNNYHDTLTVVLKAKA